MRKIIYLYFVIFIINCISSGNSILAQQVVSVKNSPRPFSVVAPASWIQQPPSTGNSRIKFISPSGTPSAECAVIVQEYPILKDIPQSTFDKGMTEGLTISEMTEQLSAIANNVKVFSVATANISGHPAQLANCQYSMGTPSGEVWVRGVYVTTTTTPGLIWIISCGATGRSPEEAQKGYSYWQ